MRYGIGTLRDNQRTLLSLIWINIMWKKSVGNKALVVWLSGDFRATAYELRAFFCSQINIIEEKSVDNKAMVA